MDPLVTLAELTAFLGTAPANTAQAELILALVSGAIRDETTQDLTAATDDEVTLRGTAGREIWLPQRPVTAVTAVTIDGTVLAPSAYRFSSDGRITFYGGAWSGIVNLAEPSGGAWGGDEITVTVTYSHGYDPIPDGVRAVALEMARRALNQPDAGAITQESLGAYSVSYAKDAALTITPGDRRRLRRYKRRIYSVPVARSV